MDDRGMIERRCESEMWAIKEWREEDEDAGLYADDQGELALSVVGAEEYGNQRVHVGFTPDEYDGAVEVRDLGTIELL